MAELICTTCRERCGRIPLDNCSDISRDNDDDHHFVIIAKGNSIEGVEAVY